MMHVHGGTVDVTTYFVLRLAADGTEATGLTITNFDLQYVRSGATPAAKVDATALAATNSAHGDNQAIEIDATDQPGLYRVDWPDAAFAAGVKEVILSVKCATCFTEHLRVMIDPPVNVEMWNATDVPSEHTAGYPIVTIKDGTGTGEVNTNGGKVVGVELVDVLTTYTGNTVQTGDSFARIGATGSGLTTLATQASVNTIDGIVDDILVDTAEIGAAGAGLTAINLPNQTMDIVGNITGNLSGSVGSVTGSVGSVATGGIAAASFAAGAIDATAIAANAIGASELAADAVTEIQSGLALSTQVDALEGDVTTLLSRIGTPSNLGGGATISANLSDINDDLALFLSSDGSQFVAIPWNASWDAEVQSEVNDAIVVNRLDELLAADSDIDGVQPPTVGSVFHELMTKTPGSFTFDQTTDSLEALRDRGDAAWITATGFSIAGDAMALTSAYDFAKGTVAMTESYNTDGAAATPIQALYVLMQRVTDFAIAATTITVKKLDGTTTAYTLTINSATAPTTSTRAT